MPRLTALSSPFAHAVITGGLSLGLLTVPSWGVGLSAVAAALGMRLFQLRFRSAGVAYPDPELPLIPILHGFGSERRSTFLHHWVSPVLWQFGQPVVPLDPGSSLARKRAAPRKPAWTRAPAAFVRVLDPADWRSEVPRLLKQARVVIVDTTVYSPNLQFELDAIEEAGMMAVTLSLHDAVGARDRGRFHGSEGVTALLENSLEYSLDSPEALALCWRELVLRVAGLLGIAPERVPRLVPPPGILLYTPQAVHAGLQNLR